jgi:hypothetical protein
MIVIASFALFAVNQTSAASTHQQHALGGPAATTDVSTAPATSSTSSHESSLRKALDEASEWLTSPFAGLTSGSHSEWAVRGVDLLLALVVYGLFVGFLVRMVRVRI